MPKYSWAFSPTREYAISKGKSRTIPLSMAILNFLFNKSILSEPVRHIVSGCITVILGSRARNCETIFHFASCNIGNRRFRIGKPTAAVGAKRNNGLAGQIVAF